MLRLKFERLSRHWTQEDLADFAQVTQPLISLIEQGRYVPSARELARLSEAFSIAPEALLKPVVLETSHEVAS